MIKTMYYSIKLDTYYAVNSLIYTLRKVSVFRDIFTEKAYQSKILKFIIGFFGLILSLFRSFASKIFYFFILMLIANYIAEDSMPVFYHLFFFFSFLGLFLNNKLMNNSMKKYLCLNVFEMDAKNYLKYNLFWISVQNVMFNAICFYLLKVDYKVAGILIGIQFFMRIVGEAFDILYFRTFQKFWYDNYFLYFPILGGLLVCAFLPFKDIIITSSMINLAFVVFFVLGILGLIYILSYDNYQSLFKNVRSVERAIASKDNGRDAITDIRDNDIIVSDSKISNKTGYDYFHTIFYERHRGLLLKSAKNNAILLGIGYVILSYLSLNDLKFQHTVYQFFQSPFGWFVFLMYFINCGGVVTRAMFYNCDHAMLRYNFYRNPEVVIGLFKKRLRTIVLVNLLPAFVIAFGNLFLMFITGDIVIIDSLLMFVFLISLSVFFSVHHLVMYYLLQPYDRSNNMRNPLFVIINVLLYVIRYLFSRFTVSMSILSISGLAVCILYIIIGISLVKHYGPKTFKI